FKYALLDYVPQRYLRRASFDTLENDRFILDFKSGRRYATDKASRLIGKALSLMDLKDTVIVHHTTYKYDAARTSFHRHSGCIKIMRERCAYGLSTIGSSSFELESLSLAVTFTPSVATSIHSISTSVNARVARRPFFAEPPPRL
ncbi:MAG: hypothetical protein F083_2771, partial [bacterium F083]